MHVHSLLPFLGLSFFTLANADDTSGDHFGPNGFGSIVGAVTSETVTERRAILARGQSSKRDAPTICADLPAHWTYQGCFNDSPSNRALNGPSYHDDTGLTENKCIQFCDSKGYNVAGVEFGRECFCGNSLGTSGTPASEFDCNMPCSGESKELCGAGDRLNVFTNGDAAPTPLPSAGSFNYIGCFSDTASGRTLTKHVALPGLVRVTDCTSACSAQGFSYAGLSYGDECYCGSSLSNGGHQIAESSCNMPCTADRSQLCGGRDAITVYHSTDNVQLPSTIPNGWSADSCYTDDVSHRTLSHQISLSSVSVASCVSACSDAGYSYAGVEYGSECFCGDAIASTASKATSGCDMSCNGNRADICGGAARINIYSKPKTCGQRGCYNGSWLLSSLSSTTLGACLDTCRAMSDCVDVQLYETDSYQRTACNLLKGTRAQHYDDGASYGVDTYNYCQNFIMYDRTCEDRV